MAEDISFDLRITIVGNDENEIKAGLLTSYTYCPRSKIGVEFMDHYHRCRQRVIFEGKPVELGICDTNKMAEYIRLQRHCYPDTDVFILVFSVGDIGSYTSIKETWSPELHYFASGKPILLVGAQIELRDDADFVAKLKEKGQSPVTYEQGAQTAKDIDAFHYIECSFTQPFNVCEVFDACIVNAMVDKEVATIKKKGKYDKLVLWVDASLSDQNKLLTKTIESKDPKVKVVSMTSNYELIRWLESATKSSFLSVSKKFIVITNRYRKTDGGDHAAFNLITAVHGRKKWKSIPIIIYCGNAKAVKDVFKNVKVSDKATEVLSWCTTQKNKLF